MLALSQFCTPTLEHKRKPAFRSARLKVGDMKSANRVDRVQVKF